VALPEREPIRDTLRIQREILRKKKIREQSVMNCCFNFFNNEETRLIISKKYMYIY